MSVSSKRKRAEKVPRRVPGVAAMVGTPPTIHEASGKVWRVGFNTQDAKGRLEEAIRSHIIRNALKAKRLLGGDEGEEVYDAAIEKIDGGHYLTFALGWRKTLRSDSGAILYLYSLLQEHHPDVTEVDAERLLRTESEQTHAAIRAISPDFWVAMAIQKGESPANAPALAAAIVSELAKTATTPEPASAGAPSAS